MPPKKPERTHFEDVLKLEIGDLIQVTDWIDYVYEEVGPGQIGIVYDANDINTRYSILTNTGARAEISNWDLDQNRVKLLAHKNKAQEKNRKK